MFDTFEPFRLNPDTGDNDPARGLHEKCASSVETVAKNFGEWKNINIVKGRIPKKLPSAGIEKVALLHIDLNHSTAECDALRYFWPKIVNNGVVLLDDYAMNSVAAEFGVRILTTGSAQGIILKLYETN